MSDLEHLIHRYLDDRDGLDPEELDALVDGLKADPARAAELREQLLVDDLLAQKLTTDRRNFLAQVDQRLADFERNEDEIDNQVSDLRALAEAEIQHPHPASTGSGWVLPALAIAGALLIGAFLVVPRVLTPDDQALAKVVNLEGDVTSRQNDAAAAIRLGGALLAGQEILTPAGAGLTLQYADKTQVQIGGDSQVTLSVDRQTGAKRVDVRRGEVLATIAPQPAAMQFITPHAVATVLGTELRLTVGEATTLLDVTSGTVQFDRRIDNRSIIVRKHESGLASSERLELRQLLWPADHRDAITYLADPFHQDLFMVSRNPETGNLRQTPLEARGSAAVNDFDRSLDLSGGWLLSAEAGEEMLYFLRAAREFSLEIVLHPPAAGQSGPARIIALADDGNAANFRLAQEGNELAFAIETDAPDSPHVLRIPAPPAQNEVLLTFVYGGGELAAYQDGMQVAIRKGLSGSFNSWHSGPLSVGADARGKSPWKGTVQGFAVFTKRLAPGDVARNVHNFRALAGR